MKRNCIFVSAVCVGKHDGQLIMECEPAVTKTSEDEIAVCGSVCYVKKSELKKSLTTIIMRSYISTPLQYWGSRKPTIMYIATLKKVFKLYTVVVHMFLNLHYVTFTHLPFPKNVRSLLTRTDCQYGI